MRCPSLVAPQLVGSSQSKDRTPVFLHWQLDSLPLSQWRSPGTLSGQHALHGFWPSARALLDLKASKSSTFIPILPPLFVLSHGFKYRLCTDDPHIYLPKQDLSSELETLLSSCPLGSLLGSILLAVNNNRICPSTLASLVFSPILVNGNTDLKVLVCTKKKKKKKNHPTRQKQKRYNPGEPSLTPVFDITCLTQLRNHSPSSGP